MKKIIFFLFSSIASFSQEYKIPISPKSPDVSSIGKFIDTPVSFSSGTTDISIPLFEKDIDGIIIPINLKYFGGGFKVNEVPSNIGLGWNLTSTSFITRNIRGTADDYSNDLNITINRVEKSLNSNPGSAEYVWLENSLSSELDTEPDEYVVNLFNESFRIYYDFSEKKFISVPKLDYSIEANIIKGNIQNFTIKDTDGNKYFFGTNNDIVTYPFTTLFNNEGTAPSPLQGEISTLYLSKIITKNNRLITFDYINNNSLSNNSIYDDVIHTSQFMYINNTNNFINGKYNIYNDTSKIGSLYPVSDDIVNNNKINKIYNTYSANNLNDLILNKIYIDGILLAEFKLNKELRKDYNSFKIDQILIYDKNKQVKNFVFNQSYFNDEYTVSKPDCSKEKIHPLFKDYFNKYRYRLRLDGVSIRNNENNIDNSYKFEYFPGELPSRLSYSQDLFGYYNGKNNCSLIPVQYYNFREGSTPISLKIGDANRNSDINYNKIGSLKKIVYPTKGSVEFEYENHIVNTIDDYNETSTEPILEKHIETWASETSVDPNTGELLPPEEFYVFPFLIPEEVNAHIYTMIDSNYQNPNNSGPNMFSLVLERIENDNVVQSIYLTNGNSGMGDHYPDGGMKIKLKAGLYQVVASRSMIIGDPDADPFLGFSGFIEYYIQKTFTTNTTYDKNDVIGGLRIKRITSKDSNNTILLEKLYNYSTTVDKKEISTGTLIGLPIQTEYNYYIEINKFNGNIQFPLNGATGNSNILYRRVIENSINKTDTIKTEYKYSYKLGEIGESNANYRLSTPSFQWRLNKLDSINYFKNNLILENRSFKNKVRDFKLKPKYGVRLVPKNKYPLAIINDLDNVETMFYSNFEYEYYPLYTEFPYIEEETKVENISGGTITTETNYNYDSSKHLQLTKQTTKNSKGENITTEYQYPPDLTSGYEQSPIMQEMVKRNMIATPVITKTKNESTVLSEVRNLYKYFPGTNGNLILPEFVYQKKGAMLAIANVSDRKITYNSYDTQGNLTQYTLENGIPVTIIWGYNGQYPIAKIEGTAYNQISIDFINELQYLSNQDNDRCFGLDGSCKESNLRKRLNEFRLNRLFTNSMVTVYTYDPLIGVTSIMQPNGQTEYYKYDDSNRLEEIRNDKQEVLKTFEYNYKN